MIVLASASPRRALILRSLGVRFEVKVSNVDETLAPGEDAEGAAMRLAHAKAAAVARNDPRPVLAADTLRISSASAGNRMSFPAPPIPRVRTPSIRSMNTSTC